MLLCWKVKTLKRPCWNTELTVKTWARKFDKVSSWRDFEVYDEDGKLIILATTEWVLIDAKTKKITKITESMYREYGMLPKAVFSEEITKKVKSEEKGRKICEYTTKVRDIDVNHHVNNVSYLEIAYDALPSNLEVDFANLEIFYRKQIKLRRYCIFAIFSSKADTYHRN